MRYVTITITLLAALLLTGCPQPEPEATQGLSNNAERIDVLSAQHVVDMRGIHRDILVLRDKETGREFIAVMGAGVTDIQTNGKHQIEE